MKIPIQMTITLIPSCGVINGIQFACTKKMIACIDRFDSSNNDLDFQIEKAIKSICVDCDEYQSCLIKSNCSE